MCKLCDIQDVPTFCGEMSVHSIGQSKKNVSYKYTHLAMVRRYHNTSTTPTTILFQNIHHFGKKLLFQVLVYYWLKLENEEFRISFCFSFVTILWQCFQWHMFAWYFVLILTYRTEWQCLAANNSDIVCKRLYTIIIFIGSGNTDHIMNIMVTLP